MDNTISAIGREYTNSLTSQPIKWRPGLTIRKNSDGSIDSSSLGYQYVIQTTSFIRPCVIQQKLYQVNIADFVPVTFGDGAWMKQIITNATGILNGNFKEGVRDALNPGPASIPKVDVAIAPITATIDTWVGAYNYDLAEVNQALASNNWDLITARMKANRMVWVLGTQDIAFLGLDSNLAQFPGLYSNSQVTVNTSLITAAISSLAATPSAFQALVAGLLQAYADNAGYTAQPDTFVIPYDDFFGLGAATSADFPINSMIKYMLDAFKMMTGNDNFKILPSRYGMAARNAGYWNANGTNRYVLYNRDENNGETVKMDFPVDYTLNPAMSADGFNWTGIAYGQFSGAIVYRVPEVLYFDYPA